MPISFQLPWLEMRQETAVGREMAVLRPLSVLSVGALLSLGWGCAKKSGGTGDGYDRNALLAQLAQGVIVPRLQAFQAQASTVHGQAMAWATDAASASANTPSSHAATQQAWRDAMIQWQELEVMHVGPAGPAGARTAGLGLRDNIYSWPSVNPCAVDQQLVANAFSAPGYFATRLPNLYGLDALEYVLFRTDTQNACDASATINQGGWDALVSSGELTARRAAYAQAVAAYLVTVTTTLVDAWNNDFAAQLGDAGREGSAFDSAQAAIDEVFAASYTAETITKDRKLGLTSGLNAGCLQTVCPQDRESMWANYSVQNISANVVGFDALYLGADGEGFDDFLRYLNAGELADAIALALTNARAKVDAIPGDLPTVLAGDPTPVRDAYYALKDVTDLIKSQFISVLNLKIPAEGAGDND